MYSIYKSQILEKVQTNDYRKNEQSASNNNDLVVNIKNNTYNQVITY